VPRPNIHKYCAYRRQSSQNGDWIGRETPENAL